MKWDEIFNTLVESIKLPETIEEAIEYVGNDPTCQITIEDLAFKQVVLNILVAAGLVSEKDFNDSITHFRGMITKTFAENLLAKIGHEDIKINIEEPPTEDEIQINDDCWDTDKIGKA